MSLRRKLLIILLLTALLPMAAVRGVQAYAIYNLRGRIAADMRAQLTRDAEQDLLRTVEGYAQSLDQETTLVFALLRVQAGEVERRLDGPAPGDAPEVPTPRDFARMLEEQPDIAVSSERHARVDEQGNTEPMRVSYQTQVVLRVPGGRRATERADPARDDLARLADMTPVYQGIYNQASDYILWQYTALESGLHFSYPAKAGFPAGYAPRQRGWYRQAVAADRPIGLRPFVDASTRQLITTFAQPVHDRAGQIVGVTAIDLPLARLLDPALIKADWAGEAQVVVVAPYPSRIGDPEGGPDSPEFAPGGGTDPPADVYVLADIRRERGAAGDRRRLIEFEPLAFDHEQDRAAVRDDLLALRDGVRRASIAGEDRMLAYGKITGGDERPVYALILTPTETILEPSEAIIAEVDNELTSALYVTGVILLVLLVGVASVAWGLSFRLTRPILALVRASRRVGEGDLEATVEADRSDELGELADAFNAMVPALRDRMKMRESLHVAMQVQQSLLPDAPPTIQGLDVAGHSEYCDETGGDYYDFIQLDRMGPRALAIAVGDVTGHGIAAALLMATGRALIRSHADADGSLGEVFTAVNRQLCLSQFTGRFMTLMYLIVNGEPDAEGRFHARYLSAGHDPVLVYHPADGSFSELAGHDIPLGIDHGWSFTEQGSDALRAGDVLVIGTDGIWECFNAEKEQFGKDRLRDAIRNSAGGSADDIAAAISRACTAWRGGGDQTDDITLVVVKLLG